MGWNSWYVWENHVTDKIIRDAADAMVRSGMIDHGYTYVNIDDCWAVKPGAPESELGGAPRDAEGRVNPNSRFPDMKALADYIHARGLKAGIYTSPGPLTCGGHVGAYQHEEQDVQRFVEWGYDFLKYDWCSYGRVGQEPGPGRPGEALQADRRHPQAPAARHRPEPLPVRHGRRLGVGQSGRRPQLAHSRRLRRHLRGHSRRPSSATASTFTPSAELHRFGGPGGWNDPDYLLLGYLSNWRGKTVPTPLSPDEQYTHVSLWSLLAAPLIFSGDITRLDDFTLGLLCNDEVIDVDQDALGRPGRRSGQGREARGLGQGPGGRLAARWASSTAAKRPATVTASWADLGLSGPRVVRDLWRQKDLGQFDDQLRGDCPPSRRGARADQSVTLKGVASGEKGVASDQWPADGK